MKKYLYNKPIFPITLFQRQGKLWFYGKKKLAIKLFFKLEWGNFVLEASTETPTLGK